MGSIFERARELSDELIEIRRFLHENAEAEFDLPITTDFVTRKLKEFGYCPNEISKGVITATVGSGEKTLLLRADMDALRMAEESGLPFASKTDCAHTCGHDIHTTMLLGAAKILKEMEGELKGVVKFLFQPAEETLMGAKSAVEAGVLSDPKVNAAFGMHVANDHPVMYFGVTKGATMASSDNFQITIKGKGCHGAMPHLGIDPINVGAHIHIALQEILSREVNAYDSAVLTIGQFNAGNSLNVIPETAVLRGTIRTSSPQVRDLVVERMKKITSHTAEAFNAEVVIEDLISIPPLINDAEMIDTFMAAMEGSGIENLTFGERRSMGSEDFSFISSTVPSAFVFIGSALEDKSKRYPGHNPKIIFDENCIAIGSAAHVLVAKKWFENNV